MWTVVTDYRPHAWWIAPGTDRYFVGLEETQQALEHRGVPGECGRFASTFPSPHPFDPSRIPILHYF